MAEPPRARSPIRTAYVLCAWGYALCGVGVLLMLSGSGGLEEGGPAEAAFIFYPYVVLSGVMAALLGALTAVAGWVRDRRPYPWAIPTALGLLPPALFLLYLVCSR